MAIVSFETIRYKTMGNWSVAHLLANQFGYNEDFKLERIGNFLIRNKTQINVKDENIYKRVTIRLYNKGIKLRDTEIGKYIGTKKQFIVKKGQFLMSKIDARNGAFGIATEEIDGAIITADFFAYDIDENKIIPQFLVLLTTTEQFQKFAQSASSGTTGRQRMDEKKFLDAKIPLPTIPKQKEILNEYNSKIEIAQKQEKEIFEKENEAGVFFFNSIGAKFNSINERELLFTVKFKDCLSWSIKDLKGSRVVQSSLYKTISLDNDINLVELLIRGKSPIYDQNSSKFILNQKCNRWDKIELEHSKTVNEDWYSKIDVIFFTREGDILINSTGEGTIGRASCITKEFEGLIYDSHLLLLRVNREKINPFYLTHYINSDLGQDQINSLKSAIATKQTELGINNLKKMYFILPPIEVQNDIEARMKERSTCIKSLKESVILNRTIAIQQFEKDIFKS